MILPVETYLCKNNFLLKTYYQISKYFLFFILIALPFIACNDKDGYADIPYAYINIYIYPNSTQYNELNTVSGWVYLRGNSPSRGIIVYRLSQDEFMAYERTCPYDPKEEDAIVAVESSSSTAIDSLCGSRYILTDGSPFSGPARLPLKQYHTYYNGETLHIYN